MSARGDAIFPQSPSPPRGTISSFFRSAKWAFLLYCLIDAAMQWREFPRVPLLLFAALIFLLVCVGFFLGLRRKARTGSWHSGRVLPSRYVRITNSHLAFEDLSPGIRTLPWNDILIVSVVRDEVPQGDCGCWYICTRGSHGFLSSHSLWGESYLDHHRLLRAFKKHLPGFSAEIAERAFDSSDVGSSECFRRIPANQRSTIARRSD